MCVVQLVCLFLLPFQILWMPDTDGMWYFLFSLESLTEDQTQTINFVINR